MKLPDDITRKDGHGNVSVTPRPATSGDRDQNADPTVRASDGIVVLVENSSRYVPRGLALIIENSASGNGSNYEFAASNAVGVIVSAPTRGGTFLSKA